MTEKRKQSSATISLGPEGVISLPWWVSAIVLIGVVMNVAGAVIALLRPAMMVAPGAEINAGVRVYAGYLVSRNLALAIMLLFALVPRGRAVLANLMLLTALIQILDVAMDLVEGRWMVVPVVLLLALGFFAGAARLSGQMFWKAADAH